MANRRRLFRVAIPWVYVFPPHETVQESARQENAPEPYSGRARTLETFARKRPQVPPPGLLCGLHPRLLLPFTPACGRSRRPMPLAEGSPRLGQGRAPAPVRDFNHAILERGSFARPGFGSRQDPAKGRFEPRLCLLECRAPVPAVSFLATSDCWPLLSSRPAIQ